MILPGEDGVDHINVYSKGKTTLGRWLSNFAHSPFTCEHGEFASVEAYWYWLGCEDESLRHLYGFEAKKQGRARKRTIHRDYFEDLIREAIDCKLRDVQNRKLLREFAFSTLPLCHYYEYSGRKIDAGFDWIVAHLEDRRGLLKSWYARHPSLVSSDN